MSSGPAWATARPPSVSAAVVSAAGRDCARWASLSDGKWVAAVVMKGSNKPQTSPFFSNAGKLVLLRPDGTRLVKVAEAPIGHWSQGVAFSRNSKLILVGNMVEKNLQIFEWNGSALKVSGLAIKLNGGSAAVRIADK